MSSNTDLHDNPFLDVVHEKIASLDTEMRIQWANRSYGEACGTDPNNLSGMPCYSAWSKDHPCEGCPALHALQTSQHQEREMSSPDGKHWLVRARPLFSRDGQLQGVAKAVTETTEHKRLRQALRERSKELDCLHSITQLRENPEIDWPELLQGVVNLIPSSWQHPEITCARIRLQNEEYWTENFRETNVKLCNRITAFGEEVGHIEVCYFQNPPQVEEDPFLEEEKKLLETIADRLSGIV